MIALNKITSRQFRLTRVRPITHDPSSLESTRAITNIFVQANAKCP